MLPGNESIGRERRKNKVVLELGSYQGNGGSVMDGKEVSRGV